MLMRKTFRYRAYPSEAHVARLSAWEGALRFLWNIALEQRRTGLSRPHDERVFPTAFEQIRELTALRAALPWLADAPRNVCAHLLVELDKAWQRCFKKISRAPRWKRKGRDSLSFTETHPKAWRLNGDTFRFPKLGNVRVVVHRPLEGKPKTCTLKRDGDQWFASIVCEIEVADPARRDGPVVAIDRGVVNVVGDSDGRLVQSPRFFEQARSRLARAQQNVDRKKSGSKNRAKAQLRVMRIHREVRRQREHFLHVLSSDYAKSHGVVVLERLRIGNMTKSASGTLEEPGRKIRQKSGLNRGILDAGWSRLGTFLGYKLEWTGGRIEWEEPAFSSQTCSACGHVDAASRVSQSVFRCTVCCHTEHADINAPKVLKHRYETRANRSGKPGDGTLLEGAGRARKRVSLRVPRNTAWPPKAPTIG